MNENGDILASQSIYETGVVSTEVASSGNYYVAVYDSFDTEDYTLTATYSSVMGSRETERVMMPVLLQIRLPLV